MTKIIQRHDTAANWTSVNPTLSQGEFGVEDDTGKFKIGDGQKAWNSLPYASSGGAGGSGTQITSADGSVEYGELALGDTLAVENGVLNTNLDEIGNEVNTLAGRVTNVENEVAKKEDVITAIKPIILEKKVISTLTGISETDSTIQTINRSKIDYLSYQSYGQYYNSDGVYLSNIIQPYTFGQVVKYPYNNDMLTAVLFGHPTENENGFAVSAIAFPCASQQYSGYDADYKTGGININGCTELPTSSPASKNFSTSAAEHAANVSADKVDGYCYAQIIVGGNGELILGKYGQQYSLGRGILSTDVFRDGQADVPTGATASAVAGITHVMWIFGNANTIYNKSLIGLYDVQPRMPWNFSDFATFEAGLGENLLDLSSNVSQNYLQLDIGDGLSVVNGKLIATSGGSTTPENMVTTDTEQEITGSKLFSNGLKVGGYAGISDNNNVPFIKTVPDGPNTLRAWEIGCNDSAQFKDIMVRRDVNGRYINIDSGNINDYISGIEEQLVNKTDKVQAAQASMPSGKYINLELGASGTTYTAPANGWIYVAAYSNDNSFCSVMLDNMLDVSTSTSKLASRAAYYGSSDSGIYTYVPVSKGDIVKVSYIRSTLQALRFIYAQGESEE